MELLAATEAGLWVVEPSLAPAREIQTNPEAITGLFRNQPEPGPRV
jgi:hypothetical protein